ncbi:uncharacterized protein MELLADRAFT_73889 [Melampsora larici-populina 98AG31]|uniref:Secreted protein n=1 Tax=Melampsora larici-populina (strain 98AG31 / pathotype 3-4-7) TaxID=747676 RepID=F4R4U8_MELLP|nr:uncharacterized protein MELLADRAFT_73889 [Melampsora larici-populina 98AG31]EGG12938.1 secreted protein [Melampsora larici-populina 98AG31]
MTRIFTLLPLVLSPFLIGAFNWRNGFQFLDNPAVTNSPCTKEEIQGFIGDVFTGFDNRRVDDVFDRMDSEVIFKSPVCPGGIRPTRIAMAAFMPGKVLSTEIGTLYCESPSTAKERNGKTVKVAIVGAVAAKPDHHNVLYARITLGRDNQNKIKVLEYEELEPPSAQNDFPPECTQQ